MSFERPDLATLIARAQAMLTAKLGLTAPIPERTPDFALCNVVAALADGCHSHLDYLARQLFPASCDETFLALHAAARRVSRKEGEATDAWRARVCAAWRDPQSGGDGPDLVAWALELEDVGRAWVRPGWQGLGTVAVLFAGPGDYDQAQAVLTRPLLQAHLDAMPPLGIEKTALVPTVQEISLEAMVAPLEAGVHLAVDQSVHALFRGIGPGETILRSRVERAIANTAGVMDFRLDVPAADVVLGSTSLPVVGETIWTAD